jgi:hypothetical protein
MAKQKKPRAHEDDKFDVLLFVRDNKEKFENLTIAQATALIQKLMKVVVSDRSVSKMLKKVGITPVSGQRGGDARLRKSKLRVVAVAVVALYKQFRVPLPQDLRIICGELAPEEQLTLPFPAAPLESQVAPPPKRPSN